jgi:histidinol-phosphate aminotransferase
MRPTVTPNIESLVAYEAGKPIEELAREAGIRDAIKLASNENPYGPSPRAMEAVRAALHKAHRYPDAAAWTLREKLSQVHGVPMTEILHGNGSNELIELCVRTFTTAADHVVFAAPSFVMYQLACLAHGTPFTAVPLRDETHDLEAMVDAVTPATRLLFVANPNNPTGTHVGRDALVGLLRRVPSEVIVVMDEAYVEYADAPDYADALSLRAEREALIVLRTFSKIHGLAALRVGYAIGPARLIDYMNRVRAPFNVNALAQIAAVAALDDAEHIDKSRSLNRSERARVQAAFGRLGLGVTPSQTNFVWVDLHRPGREVYQLLLQKGVIVRPIGNGNHVRITVGTPAENDRLLEALNEVLA